MASVWIIEVGSYSNYRIVGIYSTKENAQLVADRINNDCTDYEKATVKERMIDPLVHEVNEGWNRYRIRMNRDGDVEMIEEDEMSPYTDYETSALCINESIIYRGKISGGIFARDAQHAIKIANEFRAQMVAEGKL